MKKLVTIITILIFMSCSSTINTNIINKQPPLNEKTAITILKIGEEVPSPNKKVGTGKFGDSAFSVKCSLDYVLDQARAVAKENGANTIKITHHKRPDFWSSCHRVTVEYYFTDIKN
ncbi:hypothetical protein [Myroides injenensis]|uniref:hypothetical protein n=1 Tax=Myroides injenensis TaxID=1183151 RepID=UPI0002885CF6|nr:hypothetical protein [Myroides injenensis]